MKEPSKTLYRIQLRTQWMKDIRLGVRNTYVVDQQGALSQPVEPEGRGSSSEPCKLTARSSKPLL